MSASTGWLTPLTSISPVLALSSAISSSIFLGCSSDDLNTPDDSGADQSTTDASVDTSLDAPKDTGKDTTVIDAKVDAPADTGADSASDGATDGAADGGPDASDGGDGGLPPPGSPCSTINEVQQQDCGLCGFQKRACLPVDGGGAWGGWGFCQNQVVNGCDPKLSYPDSTCGNCGTQKTVCLQNCNYDLSQACTEPPNACKPQATEFVLGLSCDGGGRERTCDNQCAFGNFGVCQAGPTIPGLTLSSTVGQTVTGPFTLPASPKLARIDDFSDTTVSCPTTLSSSLTSYTYLSLKNPTAKTAKVSIWTAKIATSYDTVIAVYPGNVPPADNSANARQACQGLANDNCDDITGTPLSCQGGILGMAGLMSGDGASVSIPPNGTVVVYVGMYSTTSSGTLTVAVRTESLN